MTTTMMMMVIMNKQNAELALTTKNKKIEPYQVQ